MLCCDYQHLPDIVVVVVVVCRMGGVRMDKVRVNLASIIRGTIKRKSQYCKHKVIDKYPLPCEAKRVGRNRLSASVHSLYHTYSKLLG